MATNEGSTKRKLPKNYAALLDAANKNQEEAEVDPIEILNMMLAASGLSGAEAAYAHDNSIDPSMTLEEVLDPTGEFTPESNSTPVSRPASAPASAPRQGNGGRRSSSQRSGASSAVYPLAGSEITAETPGLGEPIIEDVPNEIPQQSRTPTGGLLGLLGSKNMGVNALGNTLLGAGLGAGLGYLIDPRNGILPGAIGGGVLGGGSTLI